MRFQRFCLSVTPFGSGTTKAILDSLLARAKRQPPVFYCQRGSEVMLVCAFEENLPPDMGVTLVRDWLTRHLSVTAWKYTLSAVRCNRDSTMDPPPRAQWLRVEPDRISLGLAESDEVDESCPAVATQPRRHEPEPVAVGASDDSGEDPRRPPDSM